MVLFTGTTESAATTSTVGFNILQRSVPSDSVKPWRDVDIALLDMLYELQLIGARTYIEADLRLDYQRKRLNETSSS